MQNKRKTKQAAKTPAKGARTPVKGKKKPTQITKRGTTQAAKRGKKTLQKKPVESIFAGASEISVTENKIAVTRSTSKSKNGKYSERTTRDYHDKTPANMKALKQVMINRDVKKITVKLK